MLNAAGTVLTYTDIDGDLVKVTFTGGVKMTAADFNFTTGSVDGTTTTKQALTYVQLEGKTGAGFNLAAAAQRIGGVLQGDSHANIKTINGFNTSLGTINVDGNVELFNAGTGAAGTVGVKSFTALSAASFGETTGGWSLRNVGSFTIKTDIISTVINFAGSVKSITVGGNLLETSGNYSGLKVTGDVGTLKIGGSAIAQNANDPHIWVTGNVGTLSVAGSVIGGFVDHAYGMRQIHIGGHVKSFTIGRDLIGGQGEWSGAVLLGSVDTFKIGGSVVGADNTSFTGYIHIERGAKSITIGGGIVGGDAVSGTVSYNGDVLVVGNVGTFKVGGDFVAGRELGGQLSMSNMISVTGTVGTMTFGGSIRGTADHFSYISVGGGELYAGILAAIKTLNIKGTVSHTSIVAGYAYGEISGNPNAGFGNVTIGGSFIASYLSFGLSAGPDNRAGNQDDITRSSTATASSIKIGGAFRADWPDDPVPYYISGPIIKKFTVGKASYAWGDLDNLRFDSIGIAIVRSSVQP